MTTASGVPGTPPPGVGVGAVAASEPVVGVTGGEAGMGKMKARDLLRKHYGLGVGPPPPMQGKVADPMDLGVYR